MNEADKGLLDMIMKDCLSTMRSMDALRLSTEEITENLKFVRGCFEAFTAVLCEMLKEHGCKADVHAPLYTSPGSAERDLWKRHIYLSVVPVSQGDFPVGSYETVGWIELTPSGRVSQFHFMSVHEEIECHPWMKNGLDSWKSPLACAFSSIGALSELPFYLHARMGLVKSTAVEYIR